MIEILSGIGALALFTLLLLAWPISSCLFDLIQSHRKGRR